MLALDGNKTYLMVIFGVITVVAYTMGYLSVTTMTTLLALEGFGSIAALRDAISKIEDHVLPIEVSAEPVAEPVTVVEPAVPTPPTPPTVQDVTNLVTAALSDLTTKLNSLNTPQ